MRGYSTREVAEVLGLPSSRIRRWARAGLLEPTRGPRGEYVFSFQDIVLLRTAAQLLDQDVPARRVRAALVRLREQLPTGRPLSAVRITAVGDDILVHDGTTTWEPDTGQVRLDFGVAELASDAEPVLRRAFAERAAQELLGADEWYDTAVDLEAVAPDRAKEAYRRALGIDPRHPDAHLNLGRLLHEEGAVADAEGHYRSALQADPGSGRAFFNLGVALEDQGRRAAAAEAYTSALRLDPDLAVAHFNLSRIHEAEGREAEALHHLAAYKRLLERGGMGA